MDISDDAKNKGKSNKETSKIDQQLRTSQKRRALVKGSAAVLPAIFTLRSGAVFAFGSSTSRTVAQCIENAAMRAEPAPISEMEDEWFRRETVCRTLQLLDPVSQQPSGDEFVVYLVPDTANWKNAEKTQKWIDVPPDPNATQQRMQLEEDGTTIANVTALDTPCFVLVLVDAEGMEVGLAASPDGIGSPLILSCMVSIIAA